MRIRISLLYISLFVLLAASHAYASCGSGACTINTNWDEHTDSMPGLSLDLRHGYSDANVLRSGTKKIEADTADTEVENLRTLTRITLLSADYTLDQHWGVILNVPYVSRDHMHNLGPYAPDSLGVERFNTQALGDIKLAGRFRMTLNEEKHDSVGIKLGVKLATGHKDVTWEGTTTIPGEVALQPGNGSTDLILGAFWNQPNAANTLNWFAQLTAQSSIEHSAVYRPGDQINADVGTRYYAGGGMSLLLQLNAQWNAADSGSSAPLTVTGSANSGGDTLAITPGLSFSIAADTNVYGLVQFPLIQSVNGQQLTANNTVTVGLNHRY